MFSYAGWQTKLRGLDCSRCADLRFRIRGLDGGEKLNVYLDDGAKRWSVELTDFIEVTKDWKDVVIPLEHFAQYGVDLTHLAALELIFEWERMSGTVYIDDIRFGRGTAKTKQIETSVADAERKR